MCKKTPHMKLVRLLRIGFRDSFSDQVLVMGFQCRSSLFAQMSDR